LPQITIEQVKTARQIKKMFTGDLNSEVKGYPKFDGLERHYVIN
jgi:radial spoke head protein 4A